MKTAIPALQYSGSNPDHPRPEPCRSALKMDAATVVDAVNAVDNEVARRLVIAALRRRNPAVEWLIRPGGWLDLR